MSKLKKEDFGYLGRDYQLRLLNQLVVDTKFANNILGSISPNYFDEEYLKLIVQEMKNAYNDSEVIPDLGSLEFRLINKAKTESQKKFILGTIDSLRKVEINDTFEVQEIGLRFCKQQELKKAAHDILRIIEKGSEEEYDQCEMLLRKALEVGNDKDEGMDIFDNILAVLDEDFRDPIPTGIKGLDDHMNGGLAKGELALIIAALGIGKTTLITKIANSAFNQGKTVVQIFFEDQEPVIQKKHIACWTGITINDLSLESNREIIKETVERQNNGEGKLILKRFPSNGVTMNTIKKYIRKLIAKGHRPDLILLDYIDCVESSKHYDDQNVADGKTMREFETLLSEFNIAGWVATQGNRSSIQSEVVDTSQVGGSIKKGQIAHFIMSIARTVTQKDVFRATAAILKSRFGKDGIIFQDIIFNNGTLEIEMVDNALPKTFLEKKIDKSADDQERINKVMDNLRARGLGPTS